MIRENFRPYERNHEPLKSKLPLITMGLYIPPKLFKSCQMRNFMHQRHKKPVLIKAGINRYLVVAIGIPPVIAMTGNTFVYNFKVNAI